jgi:hypothetical protein
MDEVKELKGRLIGALKCRSVFLFALRDLGFEIQAILQEKLRWYVLRIAFELAVDRETGQMVGFRLIDVEGEQYGRVTKMGLYGHASRRGGGSGGG